MSIRKKARKKAKAAGAAVPFNAADVANIATANPYIKRLIEDAALRDSVKTALDSSRSAYARLSNGKAPAKVLLDDKKLHHDLRTAVDAVRDATAAISDVPKKKSRRLLTVRRTVLLAGVGSVAAVATNEKLRSKVLDTLFGAEEEFEYTPPAPPMPAPAPEPVATGGASVPTSAPTAEATPAPEAEATPGPEAAAADVPGAEAAASDAPAAADDGAGSSEPEAAASEHAPAA